MTKLYRKTKNTFHLVSVIFQPIYFCQYTD